MKIFFLPQAYCPKILHYMCPFLQPSSVIVFISLLATMTLFHPFIHSGPFYMEYLLISLEEIFKIFLKALSMSLPTKGFHDPKTRSNLYVSYLKAENYL